MGTVKRLACGAIWFVVSGCSGSEDFERTGELDQEAVVCGVGPTVPGIDVSYYQGKPDWQAVADSGIKFAITRTNDGGFMDPEFDRNWKMIRDVGMVRGAYQFFRSTKDPIEFADIMLDRMGPLGPGDIAPVIDVEATNDATPEEMAAKVAAWIEHVEQKTGRRPLIYTGKYFWNDNVKTTALKDYPLWHAQYTSAECPNIAEAWSQWAIWQFTSSGMHPGITGNVDTNRLNGDELVLQDLAANGYRASIVSLDYPASLEAGEVGIVELVLKNEGARAWGENTQLGTTEPRDRSSPLAAPSWVSDSRILGLESPVPSGETVTLAFEVAAPAELGTYVEHLNLVEEGVAWFSDLAPGGGPMDDALALTIEVVEPSEQPTSTTGAGGGDGGGGGAEPQDGVPNHRGSRVIASCAMAPVGVEGGGGGLASAMLMLAWLRVRARSTKIRRSWPHPPSTRSSACSPASLRRSASPRRSCLAS